MNSEDEEIRTLGGSNDTRWCRYCLIFILVVFGHDEALMFI